MVWIERAALWIFGSSTSMVYDSACHLDSTLRAVGAVGGSGNLVGSSLGSVSRLDVDAWVQRRLAGLVVGCGKMNRNMTKTNK